MDISILKKNFQQRFLPYSITEYNTTEPLDIGSITDLPLLRMLLAVCQESLGPSFWEVIVLSA